MTEKIHNNIVPFLNENNFKYLKLKDVFNKNFRKFHIFYSSMNEYDSLSALELKSKVILHPVLYSEHNLSKYLKDSNELDLIFSKYI